MQLIFKMTDKVDKNRLIFKPIYAILVALFLFLSIIFLFQISQDSPLSKIFSDCISPLLNLTAAVLLFRAARYSQRISNKLAKAWYFFSAALFSYALGDLIWAFIEIVLKKNPFPSLADFGYIVFYVLFLIGTGIISYRAYSKLEWLKHLLDLGIIAVASGLGYWNFILQPLSASLAHESFELRVFTTIYPVFDLILIIAIFWLINSDLRSYVRLPILFLVLGSVTLIVTDTVFSYQVLDSSYITGQFVDKGWLATSLLFGLAGYFEARSVFVNEGKLKSEPIGQQHYPWQQLFNYIPYLWLIFAFSLLSPLLKPYVHMEEVLLYYGVTVIGMFVVARQIITLEENRWLTKRLETIMGHLQKQAQFLEESNKELKSEIVVRQKIEEKLSYEALHDPLTNLPNRTLFSDRLEQAIANSKASEEVAYSVLFLDIDQFKVINDSMGHAVGDKLLMVIAQRLKESLRISDTAARLGGDEFVILLENTPKTLREETISFIVNRIQDEVQRQVDLDGTAIFFTTSIGIVLDVTEYENASDVLRDADIAMYRAKALGKDRYEIFHEGLHPQTYSKTEIADGLQYALENQEFELQYQPIIALNTYDLIGFESFIRWNHPLFGSLLPNDFILIAEESGLILPIGQWVLQESCRQTRLWQEKHISHKDLTIQVNISGKQFAQENFAKLIEKALDDSGLSARMLKLEITEGVLIENFLTNRDKFQLLSELGVQIEIDNFGTGFSSLAYIQNFPIQIIKIDRSFVKDVAKKTKVAELVRAIISMAHDLGLETVAEGIETMEQLNMLKKLNCDFGQGFLISDPLSISMAGALLEGSARLFPKIIGTEGQ
jgi:diguanylate cyclase (GGDEF)-like protein